MIRSNQANIMDNYDDLDKPASNKWLLAFKAGLRGRLVAAIALGSVLGAGAAASVFFSIPPKFQSTALLRVNTSTLTILRNTGDQSKYNFSAQIELIKSRRVTDMAMQTPGWQVIGRGFTPVDQAEFRSAMSVAASPESEVLRIGFSDIDQAAAKAGAQAIVDAYLDLFNEQEQGVDRNRLDILENREKDLRSKLDSMRDEVKKLVGTQGREGLRQQYASSLNLRNNLLIDIRQTEDQIKLLDTLEEEGKSKKLDALTPQQAARISDRVAILMGRRQVIEDQLSGMEIAGRGDEDRRVRLKRRELQEVEDEIETEVSTLDPADFLAMNIETNASAPQLKAGLQSKKDLQVDLDVRLEDLGANIVKLNDLEKEERIIEARLSETRSRIDTLNLEAAAIKPVDLLTLDVTHSPVNGKKKLQKTGLAGFAGFASGFLIVGGFGMLNGRVRNSQDALLGITDRDLIGLIPKVDSKTDPESVALAEQSIDHLRSMLQVGTAPDRCLSLAITGPISGSGKTSVSMLLGRSFAEAGYKTLLVDFDFVGQGLSAQFRRSLAPRIGDLLESCFGVSRDQIEHAATSGDPAKQLGSKLCDMGLISDEELDRALRIQSGGADPLRRVIEGRDINECVVKTRVSNLYALPLGKDDGGRVGQKAIDQLLKAAGSSFEVVVMDTGPTPGAVEGGLAVASVTKVLVVVARGDERSDIETCDHFLRSVRAPVAGFVMNRADQVDLKSSRVSLSLSRRSQPGEAGGALDELMASKGKNNLQT